MSNYEVQPISFVDFLIFSGIILQDSAVNFQSLIDTKKPSLVKVKILH